MFKILNYTLATQTCRFNSLFITNVYKHTKLIRHNIRDDFSIFSVLLCMSNEFFMSLKITVYNERVGSFTNIVDRIFQ